ncbi:ParA family protein [Nitrosomonas supralitoralis]|uniref:ParA family protein n=1 Tax=Nitrosomonas supralitoralis TaxID=2116706 RepID=A0A2P7NQW6_9PROT|nr:ParA family protein [Nitrosomonas supralitoralis]PSJ15876.1 ParA family protein [Nitrosomonas supralitoralis]
MPIIVFASSKGGAGKTTAAIILASELARHNTNVTLIDADPNQHSAKWAQKDGCPMNIKLIEKSTEETIIDDIDSAQEKTAFVLVDLEGTASMAVASAISRADLVITLCQGSQDDADEAAKTIKLVNRQAKVLNRLIPFAVLMTRTNPAITPRTLKHIMKEFRDAGIDIFEASLIDREAFRAIRSFGGTVNDLDPKQVSGIDKAIANAHALAIEVIERIKGIKRKRDQNHD